MAVPKSERKETELSDTPTTLPKEGSSITCKFLLLRLTFLTYLNMMIVGMYIYHKRPQTQYMIPNLQREVSQRNSFTKSYILSSYSKLGHFTS